jgi:hypothetical protein
MNAFRISFLIATDILVIAMLVSLLAGCVSIPQQNRDRNGDFVSHMASSDPGTRSAVPYASVGAAKGS